MILISRRKVLVKLVISFCLLFSASWIILSSNISTDDLKINDSCNWSTKIGVADIRLDSVSLNDDHDETPGSKNQYFIVFLIPSMPNDVVERQRMRSRYVNVSCWKNTEFHDIGNEFLKFKIMFIVGRMENKNTSIPLLEEISNHDDIFLGEQLIESRQNLRYKILWGLKKSLQEFKYKYLVKVDQDTLIDLPNLLRGVPALSRREVYTGVCKNRLFKIIKESRFKSTEYCQGGAYILSHDVVQMITDIDTHSSEFAIDSEDGYVGWLVKEAKNTYNITKTMPQTSTNIMLRFFNPFRNKYIIFNSWFYHWLKSQERIEAIFNCRINVNNAKCPGRNYTLDANGCQCSTYS